MNLVNIAYAHTGEPINGSVGQSDGWMMGDQGITEMSFGGWFIMLLFFILIVLGILALVRYLSKREKDNSGQDSHVQDKKSNPEETDSK